MFGITIDGPTDVFCDNKSVTNNVTLAQSVPKKRHNVIFYHRFCKARAAEVIIVGWIKG